MSDWQPGDLALCVGYGPDPDDWLTVGPRKGSINTVSGVDFWRSRLWLEFVEIPGEGFYHLGFRKVTAPEADAEDAETIRLLQGGRVTA